MRDCDCIIARLDDEGRLLYRSEVREQNECQRITYEERLELHQTYPTVFPTTPSVSSLRQALDGRRGYGQRFVFCPMCGHKIDWPAIWHALDAKP